MCGIAGFYHKEEDYRERAEYYRSLLTAMHRVLWHRGPDDEGIYLSNHCGLAHSRLSVIDIDGGHQPMIRSKDSRTCGIVYNGELYNTEELRQMLKVRGCQFTTNSDTEVILNGFMEMGPEFVKKMNGIFAFAVWDSMRQKLYLFQDRWGEATVLYMVR